MISRDMSKVICVRALSNRDMSVLSSRDMSVVASVSALINIISSRYMSVVI